MKVIISSNEYLAANGAHGSNIIARRHAQMLKQYGIEVLLICPSTTSSETNEITTYLFDNSNKFKFYEQLPNEKAKNEIIKIIGKYLPDILYDIHGPIWPIEASISSKIPVVSMIGDYKWFCQKTFFVNAWNRRCVAPELSKCFNCINTDFGFKRKLFHKLLKYVPFKYFLSFIIQRAKVQRYDLEKKLLLSYNYLKINRERISNS